ncbi:hypothetical protein BC829DRAFT_434120 [Chytridium lagenaria]|nr:hypothetical protein BC829DRAFT_434120 [Chytridium lagenaria]
MEPAGMSLQLRHRLGRRRNRCKFCKDIIKLNVGGTVFMTAPETLLWCPDSFLPRFLQRTFFVTCDENGAIFIDRDPLVFRCILTFLRSKNISLSDGISMQMLKDEAEYFNLQPLLSWIAESNNSDEGKCGGIMFCGLFNPLLTSDRQPQPVVAIAGDNTGHLAVAYATFFYLYTFSDPIGWTLKQTSNEICWDPSLFPSAATGFSLPTLQFQNHNANTRSPPSPMHQNLRAKTSAGLAETGTRSEGKIEKVAICGRHEGVLVAVSCGSLVCLWSGSKGQELSRLDLESPIDGLFFINLSLIVLSKTGRVGFWHTFTQNWLVKDIPGISSFDTSGTLLFLGRTDGRISYIDIEKFPLRLSDDSLLINDFFQSPTLSPVTSLSVYLTPFSSASPDTFVELAYGSQDGTVRIVIEHPQSVGRSPTLFQTLLVHTKSVVKVRLGEKSLISVCENESHVRTWKIHRFRGRLATQPGTVPISSFRIPTSDPQFNFGPYGGSDTPQIFVHRNPSIPREAQRREIAIRRESVHGFIDRRDNHHRHILW